MIVEHDNFFPSVSLVMWRYVTTIPANVERPIHHTGLTNVERPIHHTGLTNVERPIHHTGLTNVERPIHHTGLTNGGTLRDEQCHRGEEEKIH